ncbi:hypothetical protein ACSX1A_05390 [Pontibacter sp. MBLB2868]|uniref:hypothetical protein n=1 Tax=Pontibacter sp. MBLB2868 TaxID=3451555 RepID=UPI003F755479
MPTAKVRSLPKNQAAIRTLKKGGEFVGVIVLPQCGVGERIHGASPTCWRYRYRGVATRISLLLKAYGFAGIDNYMQYFTARLEESELNELEF